MLMPRQDICWVQGSIRPYESLWSVLHRFLALNITTSAPFAKEFFTQKTFKRFDAMLYSTSKVFDHEKFRKAIGLSEKEYDLLNLSYLADTFYIHHGAAFKYCPICIVSLYHSKFFSLDWLDFCPIHNVRLRIKCPNCGKPLVQEFKPKTIKNPFCCDSCGNPIVKYQKKTLLHVDDLQNLKALDALNNWCEQTAIQRNNCAFIETHYTYFNSESLIHFFLRAAARISEIEN